MAYRYHLLGVPTALSRAFTPALRLEAVRENLLETPVAEMALLPTPFALITEVVGTE